MSGNVTLLFILVPVGLMLGAMLLKSRRDSRQASAWRLMTLQEERRNKDGIDHNHPHPRHTV